MEHIAGLLVEASHRILFQWLEMLHKLRDHDELVGYPDWLIAKAIIRTWYLDDPYEPPWPFQEIFRVIRDMIEREVSNEDNHGNTAENAML